jgi:plastocyanin
LRTAASFAALGIALIAFAAFIGQTPGASADASVDVGSNYYCSEAFEGGTCTTNITAGETITWTVSQGIHTVTQCEIGHTTCPLPGGFDSDILEQGQTYSETFTDPGQYDYYCIFHPSDMFGIIQVAAVVTDSPSPPPTTAGPTAAPQASQPGGPAKSGGQPSVGGADVSLLLAAIGVMMMAGAAGFAFAAVRRR